MSFFHFCLVVLLSAVKVLWWEREGLISRFRKYNSRWCWTTDDPDFGVFTFIPLFKGFFFIWWEREGLISRFRKYNSRCWSKWSRLCVFMPLSKGFFFICIIFLQNFVCSQRFCSEAIGNLEAGCSCDFTNNKKLKQKTFSNCNRESRLDDVDWWKRLHICHFFSSNYTQKISDTRIQYFTWTLSALYCILHVVHILEYVVEI